jgi:hypothetical protein
MQNCNFFRDLRKKTNNMSTIFARTDETFPYSHPKPLSSSNYFMDFRTQELYCRTEKYSQYKCTAALLLV